MSAAASPPAPELSYQETDANSVTRLPGVVDPWFLGRYGMNLYRGCAHGCVYCDGRAERYFVAGDFARDIVVKRNATRVLDGELERAREPGFVLLGGGVSDSYQPAEARYGLARGALEIALRRGLPVHVLTKSALVERDFDLLCAINAKQRAILSFSIQTLDEQVRQLFEPGAACTADRFRLLRRAKDLGLGTGVMAMPVLPGISDTPQAIEALVARAADAGVDFVCFGGLTLRPGRQQDGYMALLAARYPALEAGYRRLYRQQRASGAGDRSYYDRVDARFRNALEHHGLGGRIPRRLFWGLMPLYAEAAVVLEHRHFEQSAQRPRPISRQGEQARTEDLARAGMALQTWARQAFARRGRKKGFSWQALEAEFRVLVLDGSIAKECGLSERALGELRSAVRQAAP